MGKTPHQRYVKMKIVLLFYFFMPGILSMSKRSTVYIEDEEIVGKFGSPADKDCKCKSYTNEAGGNCQTKFKGLRWCYLEEDKHEGCADFTKAKRGSGYWSWSACYPYEDKSMLAISNCSTTEYLYHDDNRLVLGNREQCLPEPCLNARGVNLIRSTGTVGTSDLNTGTKKECKCSSFSRGGLYGNCQSKYNGYYWCYLEPNKHEGCADFHISKNGEGRYWSRSACYQ